MARLFRSFVMALAVVGLCAALGYSRPSFGQVVSPDTPATPKAETAPAKIPEAEKAAEAFQRREYDPATTLLKEAVKKNPDLPPAHVIMFQWFAQSNQAFLARMALERAVMDEPTDPEAFVIMGNIGLQERRVTDAELQFDKSLKRKEILDPQTISGLAAVAEAREKWVEAQSQLEKLLELSPKDAMGMQRLGRALFQQGKAAEALKWLRKAKETDPANVLTPEAALARFYEQYGDHKNAVTWMEAALKKAPEDLPTRLVAAQWALETGQLDVADTHATKALRLAEEERKVAVEATATQADARLLNAKILRGLVALFRKDFKAAEKFFEDAHLQSPGNFAAKNNLALALCEQKDKVTRALELANDSYQQNPKNPETASTVGWVLYRAGYKDRAEQALRMAASSGNLSPDTAYYLAQVLYDGGNTDLPKGLLDAALKTTSFSMRPEAQALADKIKSLPPPKEKAKDSK
ncbi:MAG: tetratricopeptide repeat protein [Thermoguttaceae bacterium]